MKDNQPTTAKSTPAEPASDTRVATIRVLENGAKARGFTFGKGAVVGAVPMPHADYLVALGEAEILNIQ